jgi:hypothetical protein
MYNKTNKKIYLCPKLGNGHGTTFVKSNKEISATLPIVKLIKS